MTIEKLFIISVLSVVLFFAQSCQPNTCANGVMDGTETGIDCGGTDCPACPCGGGGTFVVPVGLYGERIMGLGTQNQIDSFGAYNYETIDGTLIIGSDNIMYDSKNRNFKLIDFGNAINLKDKVFQYEQINRSIYHNYNKVNNISIDINTDWYSVFIILFEIYYGVDYYNYLIGDLPLVPRFKLMINKKKLLLEFKKLENVKYKN